MQDKLFSDSETMVNKRPTKATDLQLRELYEEISQEIIDGKWSKSSIEDIIEDLSTIDFTDDGYDIAKEFDTNFSLRGSYDVDSEFVEYLDDFYFKKSGIINKNVGDWIQAFDIKPKYQIGTKIRFTEDIGISFKKGEESFIMGDYKNDAKYGVSKDPENPKQGILIEYERLEAVITVIK